MTSAETPPHKSDVPAVRVAAEGDLPGLVDRQERLIGATYSWSRRLGSGQNADDHLALVVDIGGRTVAHLGAGPTQVDDLPVLQDRYGTAHSLRPLWWKIHSLAVEPEHRRQGLASLLMKEALRRLPDGHLGFYGSVSNTATDAHAWYRARGFYLATPMPLPGRGAHKRDGILMVTVPDEVFFRAEASTLAQHLAGEGHPGSEMRVARREFEAAQRAIKKPPERDSGYRMFATLLADCPGPSCVHQNMGPRRMTIVGWDPEHRRVCDGCLSAHLEVIRAHDAENWCDGCHRTRQDVRVSWAVLEELMLCVQAGLCPTCRAGDTLSSTS